MSTIAWRPTISVAALDDADGKPLPGLVFAPTPGTRKKLADGGLVFRAEPGGFRLFAGFIGGAQGPRRVPVRAETTLSFGINLADPGFRHRYEPVLSRTTGPNLYLTNRTSTTAARSSGQLTKGVRAASADAVRIVGRRFLAIADMTASPKPTTLKLSTDFAPSRSLPDTPLPKVGGEVQVPIDLTLQPERVFKITPKPAGAAVSRVVADNDLAGQGAFGVLDLVVMPFPGPEPVGGRAYTARFRRQT